MNLIYGLTGGFLIMGSVGGLEQGTMSIAACLFFATTGMALAALAARDSIGEA
jgi:hypothetical protein